MEKILGFFFWDVYDRIIIGLTLGTGCLAVSELAAPACVLAWISTALTLYNVFIRPPIIKAALHWRGGCLYLVCCVLSIVLTIKIANPAHFGSTDFIVGIIAIVVSLLTIPLYVFFPCPSHTPLLGPYKQIGTTSFVLALPPIENSTDKSSFDRCNSSLPVQVWFPMQKADERWLQFIEDWVTPRSILWTSGCPGEEYEESATLLKNIAKNYKLPLIISGHLSLARTNSLWQKDMSRILTKLPTISHQNNDVDRNQRNSDNQSAENQRRFPIAIYSHGMYGWRQLHTSLCESLASLGFIVLACDHAPDCMVSRPIHGSSTDYVPFDFHVPENAKESMKERAFYTSGFHRRVRDITSLMDFITTGSMEKQFPSLQGRLNYEHICLWGHSFGGGTVMSTACKDKRPARVATLDGWMYPMPDELRKQGVQTASILNLTSHLWEFGSYQVLFRREVTFKNPEAHPKFDLVFKGTAHQNYCQTHFIAHKALLRQSKVIGPDLDPHFVISVLEYLVAAFFLTPKTSKSTSEAISDVAVTSDSRCKGSSNDEDTTSTDPISSTDIVTDLSHSNILAVPTDNLTEREHLVETQVTKELLHFLNQNESVTGQKLHLPEEIQSAVLEHLVHEQELEGFANPTTYHKVEEFLKSQQ